MLSLWYVLFVGVTLGVVAGDIVSSMGGLLTDVAFLEGFAFGIALIAVFIEIAAYYDEKSKVVEQNHHKEGKHIRDDQGGY